MHIIEQSSIYPNGHRSTRNNLWLETPLIYSPILSSKASCNVWLKLETVQPSGSFKNRGIGHLASYYRDTKGEAVHLIASSGGNAGLAVAMSASRLGVKCSVFVPSTTLGSVVQRLKIFGAEVVVAGDNLDDAREAAEALVARTENGVYISPYDHPMIFEGHSSIMHEIKKQLKHEGVRQPDAVICSVGGGGLIAGVVLGLQQTGWNSVPILACETVGSGSLANSLRETFSHTPPIVSIPRMKTVATIATSLASTVISRDAMELIVKHDIGGGGVVSVLMEDARTVSAIKEYADDHATLLEPACSASLAPLYNSQILRAALPHLSFPQPPPPSPPLEGQTMDDHRPQAISKDAPVIVIIVCGGNVSTFERIIEWGKDFNNGDGRVEIFDGARGLDTVVG